MKTDSMYLQIGYSNGPIASGLTASQGAKTKDLVRVPAPPSRYVDAVFVEVVPATTYRHDINLTRAQAAIRLYSSIFNYPASPAARLFISA
jgi:hypothetical protein